MFSRAKKWLQPKTVQFDYAFQITPNLILIVPPRHSPDGGPSDWSTYNVPQLQKWLTALYNKNLNECAMLFCSPCAGSATATMETILHTKPVDIGKESNFGSPSLAPELKSVLALCQSVTTWQRNQKDHVAIVAASRERAALLSICIQAYGQQDQICDHSGSKLVQEYFSLCERMTKRISGCSALRSHQFFLRNWGMQQDWFSDVTSCGAEESDVCLAELIIKGMQFNSDKLPKAVQPLAIVVQGEEIIFSSLGATTMVDDTSGSSRPIPGDARFVINAKCEIDADFVIRLYYVPLAPDVGHPTKLCSVCVSVPFAQPNKSSTKANITSDRKPSPDISPVTPPDVSTAPRNLSRTITVTAADIDVAVPGSLRLTMVFQPVIPAVVPVLQDRRGITVDGDESVGSDTTDQEDTAHGNSGDTLIGRAMGDTAEQPDTGDPSDAASTIDSDAALARQLQQMFDDEERTRRERASTDAAVPDTVPAAMEDSMPTPRASSSISTSSLDEAMQEQSAELLSADEAYARALQEEFDNENSSRRGAAAGGAGGGSMAASASAIGSGEDSEEDQMVSRLTTSLESDPMEFLRLLLSRASAESNGPSARGRRCVATLPECEVGPSQLGVECGVCYETYTIGEQYRILPCLHRFHKHCIDPWLLQRRDPTCPICLHRVVQ